MVFVERRATNAAAFFAIHGRIPVQRIRLPKWDWTKSIGPVLRWTENEESPWAVRSAAYFTLGQLRIQECHMFGQVHPWIQWNILLEWYCNRYGAHQGLPGSFQWRSTLEMRYQWPMGNSLSRSEVFLDFQEYRVHRYSYSIILFISPSGLSNCTNPLVDTNINKANEALRNNTDPSKTLNYLSDAIRVEKIASGNIAQLDETVKLAIEKQRELLVGTAKSRDQSSQNFTNSVLDLKDILLASNEAFWGLNLIPREIQLDHVQNNIDETLFLLAQNIAGIYRNGNFSNIGTSEMAFDFFKRIIVHTRIRSRSGGKSTGLQEQNVHLRGGW